MAIFQAYCFDRDLDGNSFLLTFPDSTVADEWWRAISDTPAVASLFTRASPQLYTHTASILNVSDFFSDSRTKNIASKFEGRFFMKKIDDKNGGFPIVQISNVANAVHANWVYIRSVAAPHIYWYCGYQSTYEPKPVTVSATLRTRFQIVVDWNSVTGTYIMDKILTDSDSIAFRLRIECTGTQYPLYVSHKSKIPEQYISSFCTADNGIISTYRMHSIRKQAFVFPDGSIGLNESIIQEQLAYTRSVWEFVQ